MLYITEKGEDTFSITLHIQRKVHLYTFKPSEGDKPLEYYTSKNPYLKNLCQQLDNSIEELIKKDQNLHSFTPTPPSAPRVNMYVKAEPLLFEEVGALLLHLLDKHIEKVYGNCFCIKNVGFSKNTTYLVAMIQWSITITHML